MMKMATASSVRAIPASKNASSSSLLTCRVSIAGRGGVAALRDVTTTRRVTSRRVVTPAANAAREPRPEPPRAISPASEELVAEDGTSYENTGEMQVRFLFSRSPLLFPLSLMRLLRKIPACARIWGVSRGSGGRGNGGG